MIIKTQFLEGLKVCVTQFSALQLQRENTNQPIPSSAQSHRLDLVPVNRHEDQNDMAEF